jgi:hypothetical protein
MKSNWNGAMHSVCGKSDAAAASLVLFIQPLGSTSRLQSKILPGQVHITAVDLDERCVLLHWLQCRVAGLTAEVPRAIQGPYCHGTL